MTISPANFEATVIRTCKAHRLNHWSDADYHACLFIESYVVKYEDYESLEPRVKTQRHVYDYAKTRENAPRIPKVEYFFKDDEGTGYLVMEHVTVLPTPNLAERTADALNWLAQVPAPSGHMIGPLGGGLIRHRVFKDFEAPLVFSNAGALERYINEVRPCR
jgi:hypothetical protein